uniref:Uncharacterized protein n=1 Tax=Anopheles culicifacies TaxID=139723 RepID=A0A182MNH7_9DIPT
MPQGDSGIERTKTGRLTSGKFLLNPSINASIGSSSVAVEIAASVFELAGTGFESHPGRSLVRTAGFSVTAQPVTKRPSKPSTRGKAKQNKTKTAFKKCSQQSNASAFETKPTSTLSALAKL